MNDLVILSSINFVHKNIIDCKHDTDLSNIYTKKNYSVRKCYCKYNVLFDNLIHFLQKEA